MRLFLDTEFNGFGGRLISLALVAEDGREWYEVFSLANWPENLHPWVREHVVPVVGKDPINPYEFARSLRMFMRSFDLPLVVTADWPEDIAHLCRLMALPEGKQWNFPAGICFDLVDTNGTDLLSAVPHNALEDARALRRFFMGARAAA